MDYSRGSHISKAYFSSLIIGFFLCAIAIGIYSYGSISKLPKNSHPIVDISQMAGVITFCATFAGSIVVALTGLTHLIMSSSRENIYYTHLNILSSLVGNGIVITFLYLILNSDNEELGNFALIALPYSIPNIIVMGVLGYKKDIELERLENEKQVYENRK